MKIGPASSPVRLPLLPLEIIEWIIGFLDLLQDLTLRQHSLWACCLLSREWYAGTVKKLYRSPLLTGTNFEQFTRTICSAARSETRATGLERLVVDLDMGSLAYESSKHLTAKLLGRTKPSLEAFIAPARSFSSVSLVPISKSAKLRRLDLSTDAYHDFDLSDLLRSLHNLQHLEALSLPQNALSRRHFRSSLDTLQWPPLLTNLQLTGSVDVGTEEWNMLLSSFPPSLVRLRFVRLRKLDFIWAMNESTATAAHIRRIFIERPGTAPFGTVVFDWDVFSRIFPSLIRLTIPMSMWLPTVFSHAFWDSHTVASQMEMLQLLRDQNRGSVAPGTLLNMAKRMPALRRIDLERQSFQAADQVSRRDLEELLRLLAARDSPGSYLEAGLFEV